MGSARTLLGAGVTVSIAIFAACADDPAAGPGGDPNPEAGASSGGTSGGEGGVDPADTRPPGLDARPTNATCRAFARPPSATGGDIDFVPAFPNMDFDGRAIVVIRSRLGASGPLRWFVAQRDGTIWTFVNDNASKDGLAADGVTPVEKAEVFFDLPVNPYGQSNEGGMLGVAFDPEFGLSDGARVIYVHYTTFPHNNVWRFRIGGGPGGFTIAAQERIFTAESGGGNHWGGDLKFGPDGMLYISLGDGGSGMNASDVQKLAWLRGRILRIDPRSVSTGYAIPATNPFSAPTNCDDLSEDDLAGRTDPCPETYAYGFRNPWRMSFDRETGRLWVGDVGTDKEEVNLVLPGKNYGWPVCDGITGTGCQPPPATTIAPVAQYRLASMGSASVTGGYVYRGSALGTSLYGSYIFADVYSDQLFIIDDPYANVADPFAVTNTYEHPQQQGSSALPRFRVIENSLPMLVSFAEDENAELYAVTFGDGKGRGVYRLVPGGSPAVDTVPEKLSQTGCVDPADPKKPAAGMIPYDLNAPFWSDGADKTRFLAIPDGATINVGPDGDLELPNESVTMKHFRIGGKLVETRLFVRHADGGWAGYSYVWNDDETDATKASPAGESRLVGSQTWRYPSRGQCLACHTTAAGGTLGLELRQLNRDLTYEATGRTANQINTLSHVGLFSAPPGPASSLPAFVSPFGTAPLEERARTYLHANCSGCHRGDNRPSLQLERPLADTRLCSEPALVVPGSPATSRLVTIMRDPEPTVRMPKNGGNVIDEAGVSLIESWISSLTACP